MIELPVFLGAPLFAIAVASITATAACAFAIGCTKASADEEAAGAGLLASDAATDPDAPPRRVCPSAQTPDGSFITVDGVDTSDYQFTNWDRVVAQNPNVKFAFSRVSSGLARVDSRFSRDWPSLKRVGLLRGPYQYFKPSQSAVAQADLFLRKLGEAGGLDERDLPPVIDVETTNDMPTATVVCRIKIWLARVERATRRTPLIYSSAMHNGILGRELARFPLWIANYVGTPSRTCPRMPDTWNKWAFWQYGETGKTVGIYRNGSRDDDAGGSIALQDGGDGGPVDSSNDVDFFDGTVEDLNAFVSSTTSTGPVLDPPPLEDPPHVPGASPDGGAPIDCSDGCCVGDP